MRICVGMCNHHHFEIIISSLIHRRYSWRMEEYRDGGGSRKVRVG